MTPEILDACTGCGMETANRRAADLSYTMGKAEIVTPLRQAMFLAQIAHESGNFTCGTEDTNYSAAQMVEFFPHEFNAEIAAIYAGHPELIANRAYANKDGNGNELSGDGFKYRGRYDLQITGLDDYRAAGIYIGVDLVTNPDALHGTSQASMTAGWEWTRSGLNLLADHMSFSEATRRINGAEIGEPDRVQRYIRCLTALHIPVPAVIA